MDVIIIFAQRSANIYDRQGKQHRCNLHSNDVKCILSVRDETAVQHKPQCIMAVSTDRTLEHLLVVQHSTTEHSGLLDIIIVIN